ncbi:MAG: hypothetical protein V4819_16345 [Verrucomicrobiota bacterium]
MPAKSILLPGEKVELTDPRVFNMNDLATILGLSRTTVRRMKQLGFKMPLGYASVTMAHDFLKKLEVAAE